MNDEDTQLLQVSVRGIVRDPRGNPVVLLKHDDGEEVLPIWIGHSEGVSIELHLKDESFERPLTHDLLKTTLEFLGASVARVAITELRDNTFYAKIYLQRENDVFVIDARPSDSIALALKTSAPIFVSHEVFMNHRRVIQPENLQREEGEGDLKRYLEGLDPGEF